MKIEKDALVKTFKNKGSHRTETRVLRRTIYESFCAQPGCEFFGKHTAQGVCHTKFSKAFPEGYFQAVTRRANSIIDFYRAQYKKKPRAQYIRFIEGLCVSESMNASFMLDELIRLRISNAKQSLRLGTYK